MRDLLVQFSVLFQTNDGFQRKLGAYERALKTEEWAFLRDAILLIRGQMAVDMFSRHHTNLDETEKDVVQRVYYNINQILEFLLEPEKWVKKRSRLVQALSNLKGKVKPNQKEGD